MIKKQLPKVTIITTTFNLSSDNREVFFEKCCESIHNQTYPNIEHIVEDGSSTDGSLELIKKYENKGWLKCFSEPDAGIDDGYNKAISHATGKYVFFMNSDDQYYADDVIEKCIEIMEEKSADYCYGTEHQFSRDGKFMFEWRPNLATFWHNVPYAHATFGIRLAVLKKLGCYNTDCGYGGDYDLMIRLILDGYNGVEVPTVISRYILGGISSQHDDKAKQYRTFFILAKRIHYIVKQFYPSMTLEDCFNIYLFAKNNPNVFPKNFLLKLIHFMLDKHLKYFNYNDFIDYVNSLAIIKNAQPYVFKHKKAIKLFGVIPLLSIYQKDNTTRYKLFGFIPLLKIKEK